MRRKVYFIKYNPRLEKVLDYIIINFSCLIQQELIEMDYLQVQILARQEDIASIEKLLAPLV